MSACAAPEILPVTDDGRPIHDQKAGPTERPGRDGRGRFLPGNGGGPGNPFGRRVALLRKTMLDTVGEEDLRAITLKLIERAREGDVAAAKLVLQYTVGRPADTVDPDRVDIEEWRLAQENAVPPGAWDLLLQLLPVDVINSVNRIAWPCHGENFRQQMLKNLRPVPPENHDTHAADGDGATPQDAGAMPVSDPAAGERRPSTNGRNRKRTPPAGHLREDGPATEEQPSSRNGDHGKHGSPSPKGGNGDATRRSSRRAAAADDAPGGDGAAKDLDAAGDDVRQWLATLLTRLHEAGAAQADEDSPVTER